MDKDCRSGGSYFFGYRIEIRLDDRPVRVNVVNIQQSLLKKSANIQTLAIRVKVSYLMGKNVLNSKIKGVQWRLGNF